MKIVDDTSVYEDCISQFSTPKNTLDLIENNISVYEACNENEENSDNQSTIRYNNNIFNDFRNINSETGKNFFFQSKFINFNDSLFESVYSKENFKKNKAISNKNERISIPFLKNPGKIIESKNDSKNKIKLEESEPINEVLEIRRSSIYLDGNNKMQILLLSKFN